MATYSTATRIISAAIHLRRARDAIADELGIPPSVVVGLTGAHKDEKALDQMWGRDPLMALRCLMREVDDELNALSRLAAMLNAGTSPRGQAVETAAPADGATSHEVLRPCLPPPTTGKVGSLKRSLNDAKVLEFLQRSFYAGRGEALTQPQIAAGAGVPRGSISLSLSRLRHMELVRESERGRYVLNIERTDSL